MLLIPTSPLPSKKKVTFIPHFTVYVEVFFFLRLPPPMMPCSVHEMKKACAKLSTHGHMGLEASEEKDVLNRCL